MNKYLLVLTIAAASITVSCVYFSDEIKASVTSLPVANKASVANKVDDDIFIVKPPVGYAARIASKLHAERNGIRDKGYTAEELDAALEHHLKEHTAHLKAHSMQAHSMQAHSKVGNAKVGEL